MYSRVNSKQASEGMREVRSRVETCQENGGDTEL